MENGRGRHRVAAVFAVVALLVGALVSVDVAGPRSADAAVQLPAGWVTDTVVSGLGEPVGLAWTPDGRLLIAEKSGVVRMWDPAAGLLPTPFIDISAQVNGVRDRGLLGIAVHPDWPVTPHVFLLFTYDPPEVYQNPPGRGGPDGRGKRASRLIRVSADPTDDHRTASPATEVVLLGSNSTAATIGDLAAPMNDFLDPPFVTACEDQATGDPLRDCLPADGESHTIGSVRFGTDGMLYVGNGDGASYTTVDPRALRSLDLDSMAGKILRIDPWTGEGPPDNPHWNGDAGANRSKVYANGLRNPFRFTIDPVSGEPFIGDVGWATWEEINTGSHDFGWPCYEGANGVLAQQGGYAALSECQIYYGSNTAQPAVHAYDTTGFGGSPAAGAFYGGTAYPAEFQGALFINDYAADWIKYLTFDAGGNATVHDFATDADGPVEMVAGPDTNLYYISILTGQVKRLRYVGDGNHPPVAVAGATPQSGPVPLTVDFQGKLSYDPDAESLDHLWDFGDGTTSTEVDPRHTYPTGGSYDVTLTVTDGSGATDRVTLTVTADNTAPTASITAPVATDRFSIDDPVSYAGTGTDPEDGTIPPGSMTWNAHISHDGHLHPLFDGVTGSTGSFDYSDHEDHSHVVLCLTVTDSGGLTGQDCVDVRPAEVTLTFDSIPSGLELDYNGITATTPFQVEAPVNSTRSINAPSPQGGQTFQSWSIGGTAGQSIVVGSDDTTLTATYSGGGGGSEIEIYAAGLDGTEAAALEIDGQTVAIFPTIGGDLTNGVFQTLTHTHTSTLTDETIRVRFTNNNGSARDLRIDAISVDGTRIESELGYSEGHWDTTNGCAGGYENTETLHCNGYIEYLLDSGAGGGSEIEIYAAGLDGTEAAALEIDGQTVAIFPTIGGDLTNGVFQTLTHTHTSTLTDETIRVRFTNNNGSARDLRIDAISVDGTRIESELGYSEGHWDTTNGCAGGYENTETLHCNGYIEYLLDSGAGGGSEIEIYAAGLDGTEAAALEIDGQTVAIFPTIGGDLTNGVFQTLTHTHTSTLTDETIRVRFTNNNGSARDLRIDAISVDGTRIESELGYSEGHWDTTNGCAGGYENTETLHCNGYIEYLLP